MKGSSVPHHEASCCAIENVWLVLCGDVNVGKATIAKHLNYSLRGGDAHEMEHRSSSFPAYMKEESFDRTIIRDVDAFFSTTRHYTYFFAGKSCHCFLEGVIRRTLRVDVALLVVSADQMESIRAKDGMSRYFARVLLALGIKPIVCVNKMDKHDKIIYDKIVEEVLLLLAEEGWPNELVKSSLIILPISAWRGDNMVKPSSQMTWWRGVYIEDLSNGGVTVHTLSDALEKAVFAHHNTAAPLRFLVSGAYKIRGVGDVITGRVEQGFLKPGMEVAFVPTHGMRCLGKVKTIQIAQHTKVKVEDAVVVILKHRAKNSRPRGGDVMILKSDPFECARMIVVECYELRTFPSNKFLTFCAGSSRVRAEVLKIVQLPNNGSLVTLEMMEECVVVEKSELCAVLGRVGLMKDKEWIGIGQVKKSENWSVRFQRATSASHFVIMAFRQTFSRDVLRIICRLILSSKSERIWSQTDFQQLL